MKKSIYFLFAVITVIAFSGCSTDAPGIDKAITEFRFIEFETPVIAEIDGTSINITLPYGTDVSSLFAVFNTTGVSVTVDGVEQISGITANDFSSPLTYIVTAEDGSTVEYTVTVTFTPNPAKDITAFSFSASDNSELSDNAVGEIDGSVITVKVPYIADVVDLLDSLVASFTTTGSSVKISGTGQSSGNTANDFTDTVVYRVTAEDGGTKDYEVNVLITVNRTQLDTMIDDTANISYITRADTSNITDMSYLFEQISFNEDISGWDVGNVDDMYCMFAEADSFNQDISGWDVSRVRDMGEMFYYAASFNQDISGWDVSRVSDMSAMFFYADSFYQDISGWDVGGVSYHANFAIGSPLASNSAYQPHF